LESPRLGITGDQAECSLAISGAGCSVSVVFRRLAGFRLHIPNDRGPLLIRNADAERLIPQVEVDGLAETRAAEYQQVPLI
jgi:hypothetical protein